MRLRTAEIDRYGPLKSCYPDISENLTIIAGPNESGKTLYLEGLLGLLDPELSDVMDPGPRVRQPPVGRVVVDDGVEAHEMDDETAIRDFSPIDANHLYNLFVIRDSDLTLPDGPNYYTSLVEHFGDIHTTAIEAIREGLLDEGKLTPSQLNLRDREYDTKTVRTDAEALAADIEEYLEKADAEGLSSLVQERLRLRRELNTVQEDLSTQHTAEELATLEDVSEHLKRYENATKQIEALDAFDKEGLEELRSKRQERSHIEERIADRESVLSQKRDVENKKRDVLNDVRKRAEKLRQKKAAVENVETTLETYREGKATTGEAVHAKMANRRLVSVAGFLGGGLAGGAGAVMDSVIAVGLGIVLFVVGGVAWYSHWQLSENVADAEQLENEVLETARDAGFAVESPKEVAPKIQEYQSELTGVESRIQELEATIDQLTSRIQELESDLTSTQTQKDRVEEAISETLSEADVESIEEYEQRVIEREEFEAERSKAETVLNRDLGEPPGNTTSEIIDDWKTEFEHWAAEIDAPDIDAEMFDVEERERLAERKDDLETELETVGEELEAYQRTLDEFERKASDIDSPPFVETDPTLDARTVEGLHNLVEQLNALVSEIERNAELSRKAVTILDTMKAAEEEKVTTLFAPEGPASRLISTITNGRYSTVNYDPDSETLEVLRSDGQTLTPRQLSRGTQDQLYFAARLSLAKQLLGGDTGFLLLDDPFLAADSNRLRRGFEMLTDLSQEGWQIIYLTAKDEVSEGIAGEFALPVHEFEILDADSDE